MIISSSVTAAVFSQSLTVCLSCVCSALQSVSQMLLTYLSRLSAIADNKINCGPALTWMEVRLQL